MKRVLYKYRNIGDLKKETLDPYLLRLLEGELFFSDPKEFNDPFDSKFTFTIDGTNDELRDDMIKRGNPPQIVDEIIKNMSREQIADFSVKNANQKFDLSRVYCFSRDPKNKLLWSHYGQYHYGVCIGIGSVSVNSESYIQIRPRQIKPGLPTPNEKLLPLIEIEYKETRPVPMNILKDRSEGLMRFITTKAIDWKYEQEERLAIPPDWLLENPVKIPKSTIKEIIFGLRTPPSLRVKLRKVVSDLPGLRFFEIMENERTYNLEIKEIAI